MEVYWTKPPTEYRCNSGMEVSSQCDVQNGKQVANKCVQQLWQQLVFFYQITHIYHFQQLKIIVSTIEVTGWRRNTTWQPTDTSTKIRQWKLVIDVSERRWNIYKASSSTAATEVDQDGRHRKMVMESVTIEELRKRQAEFAAERDWEKFHSPRNLLLALVWYYTLFSGFFWILTTLHFLVYHII